MDFEFRPLANTGKALNMWGSTPANNVNVNLYTADGSNTQRWRVEAVTEGAGGTGTYLLHCMANEAYVLDRYRSSQNADIYTKATNATDKADQEVSFTNCGTYGNNLVYYITLGDGRRLAAVDTSNGTGTGKSTTSAGNVYFGGSNDQLQKWVAYPVSTDAPTEGVRPTDLNYNSDNYNGNGGNPFAQGQCTWHAWGRAKEVTGKAITFSVNYGRDGGRWYDLVDNAISKTQTAPIQGGHAVMSWSNGTYGHVAFVEKYDGTYIWFTEANNPGNNTLDAGNGVVQKKTLAAAKAHVSNFNGFINL